MILKIILLLSIPLFSIFAQSTTSLRNDKRYYEGRLEKQRVAMFTYILNHKAATAALIGSGGGMASFLTENMDDDTRAILVIAGIFGISYCIDNVKECASVTAELASHKLIINNLQAKIDDLSRQINSISFNNNLKSDVYTIKGRGGWQK